MRKGDTLIIKVPSTKVWDEKREKFLNVKGQELRLAHSLLSISKWESIHKIPFLADGKRVKKFEKTREMMVDYVRCMTVNEVEDDNVYYVMTEENWKEVQEYINDPMTATVLKEDPNSPNVNVSGTFPTAEIIYYQMFELNIPESWEKKHLNRLLTLIRVIAKKKEQANNPKKIPKSKIGQKYRALHAARRKH